VYIISDMDSTERSNNDIRGLKAAKFQESKTFAHIDSGRGANNRIIIVAFRVNFCMSHGRMKTGQTIHVTVLPFVCPLQVATPVTLG